MQNFGKRLKQARRSKRLTQVQLAERVKVHKNTISSIERGLLYPGLLLGLSLSECLNVNIRWLVGHAENPRRAVQLESDQEVENHLAYRKMSPAERKQFADFMTDFLHTRAIAERVKQGD